ncbi:hypothetical protein BCO26_2519 [Heyndrickxia coagulans 2-6]|nr:hypothetical protein BCO26_2519 [Heyndrickxia coagulans 2-6]
MIIIEAVSSAAIVIAQLNQYVQPSANPKAGSTNFVPYVLKAPLVGM